MTGFKRRNPTDLAAQLEQLTGKQDHSDVNEWKLSTDKLGNGSAIIRFLPAKEENDTPFVKIFTHGFKHNGRWFVENCPTTLGQDHKCPVCQANGELWATEIEANKKIASARKRKLSYYANIVVIKDEANPDNQGKVFKYRFGQKIMDKIVSAAKPDADLGTSGLDVTCVFTGANFLLKSKRVSDFPNYDDSKFGNSSELFDGDEDKLTQAWEGMHDLKTIIAPTQFKAFAELQTKFNTVVGSTAKPADAMSDALSELDELTGTSSPAPVKTADPVGRAPAGDDELDALLNDLGLDD